MTVREIVDEIIKKAGVEPLPEDKTCDHLMTGSWDMEVKGIVTTFMATVDVIKQTIDLGANFIITHEPTWFSGADDTEWLSNDPVYLEKKKLIEEHNIAIWRFHDHMHMSHEDGIYRGFDEELDWAKYRVAGTGELGWFGAIYELPETTLEELAHFFQKKMDMKVVQLVGDPKTCQCFSGWWKSWTWTGKSSYATYEAGEYRCCNLRRYYRMDTICLCKGCSTDGHEQGNVSTWT